MIVFGEGTDHTQPLQFDDLQGTDIDLTSVSSLTCTVYPYPREGATASLTMTVANSKISVTTASEGKINLVFADGDLSAGTYLYEVTGTLASGAVALLGRGSLKVYSSEVL